MKFLLQNTANLPTESNVSSDTTEGQTYCNAELPQEILKVPSKRKMIAHTPPSKRRHAFHTHQDEFDKAILKEMSSTNEALKNITEDDKNNEISLYCRSLIPIISALPLKKQRKAFIQISQLLFDLEFNDE